MTRAERRQGEHSGEKSEEEAEDPQRVDVAILDIYENIASVRIDADEWVDYLHLVRLDAGWKILNVLWELRPNRED